MFHKLRQIPLFYIVISLFVLFWGGCQRTTELGLSKPPVSDSETSSESAAGFTADTDSGTDTDS